MSITTSTNQTFIAFRGNGAQDTQVCFLNNGFATKDGFSTHNGWTNAISINLKSVGQIAAAVFNGKYFIASEATIASDAFNQLQISSSSDGVTWTQACLLNQFTPRSITFRGPALAVFQNQLYMAFPGKAGAGDSVNLLLCSSADGVNWSPIPTLIASSTNSQRPALAVYQNLLFAAWQGTDGKIYLSYSSDGVTFTTPVCPPSVNGTISWSSSPALAVYNNSLYMALADQNGSLYVSSTTANSGQGWSAPSAVGQQSQSGSGLTLGTSDSMLIVMASASDGTGTLLYSTSVDGKRWVHRNQFGPSSQLIPAAIASGSAAQLPLPFRAPTDNRLFTAFQANDGSSTLRACFYDPSNAPLSNNSWTTSVSTNNQTKSQPAAVVFRSTHFIGFVASNSGNSIQMTSSADGVTWSAGISTSQTSTHGPALAVFQNQLYMAFVANDNTNHVLVASSVDGITWTGSSIKIPNAISPQPPALAVFQNLLCAAWVDSHGTMFLSASSDGVNWASPSSFTISGGCSCPGIAACNGSLYVTFLSNSNQAVYVTVMAFANGLLMPMTSPMSIGRTALSGQQPAIGANGNTLFLMYPVSGRALEYCTSTDGTNWMVNGQFGPASPLSPCLASGPAGPLPLSILGTNQLFTAFQSNDSSKSLCACFYGSNSSAPTTNGWSSSINTNNQTPAQPAAVVFRSQYRIGFVNSGQNIQITSSADGVTWPAGVSTNQSSTHGPALAVFQNKVFMAFIANDSTNHVLVTSSADGSAWPTTASAISGVSSPQPPAMAVYQNLLWVAWVDSQGTIFLGSSADGKNWVTPSNFTIPGGCSCPGLAVFNGSLYVTFLSSANQAVYVASTASTSGQLSADPVSIGRTALSGQQPAIGTYGNTLFLMYPVSSHALEYCTSTDGTNWVVNGPFGPASPLSPCLASGAMGQIPSPLLAPPSQALQISATQPVSSLRGFGSPTVTLEAWICPSSTDQQQGVILLSDLPPANFLSGRLILTVGGSSGALSLLFVKITGFDLSANPIYGVPLVCTTSSGIAGIAAGVWAHVAVTLSIDASSNLTAAFYVNGQQVPSGDPVQGLDIGSMLQSPVLSVVRLGSAQAFHNTTINALQGQMAEARIWSTARSASDISAHYLSRACGNEPGLVACYRLEDAPQGYIRDLTAQRGFGKLATGNSIVPASGLPLYPTTSPAIVSIQVLGKLVTEYITEPGPFKYSTLTLNSSIGYSACTDPGLINNRYTVFDATLQPQAPDGSSLAGQNVYICPDGNVTVFLDQGNFSVKTQWTGGQTYSLIVPPSGKFRLRFLPGADSSGANLSFPALRVRVDGMPCGVWTLVLPDEGAMQSLCNIDANDLTNPVDNRPSPLPQGMSADDTNALVKTLHTMNCSVPPAIQTYSVPANMVYRQIPIILPTFIAPQNLSWEDDLWNGITGAADGIANTAQTVQTVAGNVLHLAGSDCGSLAQACIDNGTTNFSSLTGTIKGAANLVVSDATSLSNLVTAATKAAPRLGGQAISDCIKSADKIAVGTDKLLENGFAIIGTTIVDGTTVVWRTLCTCAQDAAAAAKALCSRLTIEIQKLVDYLAWLFNWNQFLEVTNEIYSGAQDLFATLNDTIAGLTQTQYVTSLQSILTLPPNIGNQTLAQICKLNINPNNPAIKELDYVIELMQKLMGAQNLGFGSLSSTASIASSLTGIDMSSLSGIGQSLSGATPSDSSSALASPLSLITTPISGLINSLLGSVTDTNLTSPTSSPIVNFFFQIIDLAQTVLLLGESLLTLHIDIPAVTSLIETTLLGGQSLTLLRLLSLLAAIPAVIVAKITGTTSQTNNNQPTSLSTTTSVTFQDWAPWFNAALTAVFSVVLSLQAVAKVQGDNAASETTNALYDLTTAVIGIIQGGLSFKFNAGTGLPQSAIALLNASSALQLIGSVIQGVVAGATLYEVVNGSFSSTVGQAINYIKLALNGACTVGQIITAILIATTPNAVQSPADWAAFSTSAAALVLQPAAELVEHLSDKNPSLQKVAIGMAVTSSVVQIAAAIASAADNFNWQ